MHLRQILPALTAVLALVPATSAFAGNPPGNDLRKNAWTLTNGIAGTTADATHENIAIEGYRPGDGERSVWFKWTAPTSGRLTVTVNAPGFDSVVAAYTTWREFNNVDVVADADKGAGDAASSIAVDAKAGQTFNFVVDGVTANAAGAYSISTAWDTTPPAPANDTFANAATLTPGGWNEWSPSFSHRYATKEAGEPLHRTQGTSHSVWFKYTAPANGKARVSALCGDADLESTNTTVAVYTGPTVSTLSEVIYDSSDGGADCAFDSVTFPVVGGITYRIALDNASADTGLTSVQLRYDGTPPVTTFSAQSTYGPKDSAVVFSINEGIYVWPTFQCRIDGGAPFACESGVKVGHLAEGSHTLAVRATDELGNVEQSWKTKAFKVDKTPPETTITSAPQYVAQSAGTQFHFTSNDATATFTCNPYGPYESFKPCTSPFTIVGTWSPYSKYTMKVAAVDAVGNVDPTPAEWVWEVNPAKAAPAPPAPPTGTTTTTPSTTVHSAPVATTPPPATTVPRTTWVDPAPPRLRLRTTSLRRAVLVRDGLRVQVRCGGAACRQVVKLRLGRRVLGSVAAPAGRWVTLKLSRSGRRLLRRTAAKRLVVAIGDRALSPATLRLTR